MSRWDADGPEWEDMMLLAGRRGTSFGVDKGRAPVVVPLGLATFAFEGEGPALPYSVEDGDERVAAS